MAIIKITGNGYVLGKYVPGENRNKTEHIEIAERILGRPLPKGAEVHHVNEIKTDNRNSNLVICPNRAYHAMLHRRTRAYNACGHADWFKCSICKKYDEPRNLSKINPERETTGYRHSKCHALNVARRKRMKQGSLNDGSTGSG